MPIYEYRCESCGHYSEEMQKLSDPPLTECPECGGPYKKLISAPSFQFKGSGWYVNDYGKGGGAEKKGEARGESSEKGSGKSSEKGSSEKGSEKGSSSSDKGAGEKSGGSEAKSGSKEPKSDS